MAYLRTGRQLVHEKWFTSSGITVLAELESKTLNGYCYSMKMDTTMVNGN